MKVGIKYCGGCNPGFDRIELVKKIEKELKGMVKFVSPEDPGLEVLLVVEGCSTACADLTMFKGMKLFLIREPKDAEGFVRDILGSNS